MNEHHHLKPYELLILALSLYALAALALEVVVPLDPSSRAAFEIGKAQRLRAGRQILGPFAGWIDEMSLNVEDKFTLVEPRARHMQIERRFVG